MEQAHFNPMFVRSHSDVLRESIFNLACQNNSQNIRMGRGLASIPTLPLSLFYSINMH